MENILHGIKKLKIAQANAESQVLQENRQLANVIPSSVELPDIPDIEEMFNIPTDVPQSSPIRDENESSDESKNGNEGDASSSSSSSSNRRYISRRRMPPRASKDSLKLTRTAITKPKKRITKEFKLCQTLSDVTKVYFNKQLKKFNPTNLETIYEENDDDEDDTKDTDLDDLRSQVRLVKFGTKKLKRSISFGDGLNVTKTTIKKRRYKIKKCFGKNAPLIKKMSLNEFHDRLNKSFDSASMADNEDEENDSESNKQGQQQLSKSSLSSPEKCSNASDMQIDVVIAKLDTFNCDRNNGDDDDEDDECNSMH